MFSIKSNASFYLFGVNWMSGFLFVECKWSRMSSLMFMYSILYFSQRFLDWVGRTLSILLQLTCIFAVVEQYSMKCPNMHQFHKDLILCLLNNKWHMPLDCLQLIIIGRISIYLRWLTVFSSKSNLHCLGVCTVCPSTVA